MEKCAEHISLRTVDYLCLRVVHQYSGSVIDYGWYIDMKWIIVRLLDAKIDRCLWVLCKRLQLTYTFV